MPLLIQLQMQALTTAWADEHRQERQIDCNPVDALQNLCFTKKIRYESRKQLANARPRVRGQFVKINSTAVEVGPLLGSDGCNAAVQPSAGRVARALHLAHLVSCHTAESGVSQPNQQCLMCPQYHRGTASASSSGAITYHLCVKLSLSVRPAAPQVLEGVEPPSSPTALAAAIEAGTARILDQVQLLSCTLLLVLLLRVAWRTALGGTRVHAAAWTRQIRS